tara:strand:- start:5224 stop:5703 length:480 start_codon:yes stop_codon:yes gene_type:complete
LSLQPDEELFFSVFLNFEKPKKQFHFYQRCLHYPVRTIKKGKKPILELLVLFENFSGQHIHRKIRVWDTKPDLHRFQQDNIVPVGLNVARKPKDPVFLSQDVCRFSFLFVIIGSLKIIIYVMGCYFLMREALERIFAAPKGYEAVFVFSFYQTVFGAHI